ncbi:hypothetical protein QQY66_37675 [Streptomyces sp. DG2A-72]|uniref:hypothetical protein n=1 Tax=Streptomyces sp. DG2A-72 TaxID=3051386 RepID=UPI00265C0FBA|nr:hypothetical protein [Streptomyces sp. DG2A-72]MDO0937171.1 hypothetical protein [Streptomyces sp. DG2A-72]
MASDDEELSFAAEIDPELAKILAEICEYCETMPPEEALDLINKGRRRDRPTSTPAISGSARSKPSPSKCSDRERRAARVSDP